MQSELDRAMADFYNLFAMPGISADKFENLSLTPSINLVEDKDSFKVEAEMPGLDEEDVKVAISDGMLTIQRRKNSFF